MRQETCTLKKGNCILRSAASLPMGISMDRSIHYDTDFPILTIRCWNNFNKASRSRLEGLFMKNLPRHLNIRQSRNNITFDIKRLHRAIMFLGFRILNPCAQLRTKLGEKSSLCTRDRSDRRRDVKRQSVDLTRADVSWQHN